LSNVTRSFLRQIVSGFTREESLFLCCVKWEFNSNDNIDRTWTFRGYAFGNKYNLGPYITNSIHRYKEAGKEITEEAAFELFSSLQVYEIPLRIWGYADQV
jgi:hypothetical protein